MSQRDPRLLKGWNEWLGLLDQPSLRSSFSTWSLGIVGLTLVGFGGASFAPGLGPALGLRLLPYALGVGPAWLVCLALAVFYPRAGRWGPVVLLSAVSLVAYLAGCLVVFVDERAAPACAGLLALTCATHGHQGRASVRAPYFSLADAIGIGVAGVWAPTALHVGFLVLGGLTGLAAGLVVGSAAEQSERARQDLAALRSAVEAQIAAERAAKAAQLEGMVLHAEARNHDVRNALTTALLDLELLADALGERDAEEANSARGVLEALVTAVRLSREPPGTAAARSEAVALALSLGRIVRGMRARFPRTSFVEELAVAGEGVVFVEDGTVGLRRIVENLLINAAEGNGERRSSTVVIRVRRVESGNALIEIEDDGPGFSPEQLARPIRGFSTTKRGGMGLGLYTTEHLARASGGWVERSNAPSGGALVRVTLPAEGLAEAKE